MRYVARTKDLALRYSKLPSFILSGFIDSNYGGDRDDRKSTSAYVFSIGLGVVSWASNKQPTISLSTIEVEYCAMSIASQEAILLRHLLKEIRYEQGGSYLISSNNQSAISFAKNHNGTSLGPRSCDYRGFLHFFLFYLFIIFDPFFQCFWVSLCTDLV